MSKRDLFSELTTALVDAKAHSQGKLALRTDKVNDINDLAISPDKIVNIQEISGIPQQEGSKIESKDAAHQMGKR